MVNSQLFKNIKKAFFCIPAACMLLAGCGISDNYVQPINSIVHTVEGESTVLDNNQSYVDNKEYNKIIINSEEEAKALLDANALPVSINTESIPYDGPIDPETINQEIKEKYGENAEFDMWEWNIKITTYTLPDGTKLQTSKETSFNSENSFIFNDDNNNEYYFYNFMENQKGFYVIPNELYQAIEEQIN